MRILLAAFVGDNRWSGMGKWAHRVAEELNQMGHSASLWFADDFPLVRRTRRLSVLTFPVAFAARVFRERRRFDVVVVHEPGGLWYGLLRRLFPRLPPLVVMCHNVESKCYGEMLRAADAGLAEVPRGTRLRTPLLRLWQSDGSIRGADGVVCLSTADREYTVNRLGLHPGRVTRLINGVDAAAEESQPRAETAARRRVLFVGGWLDVKGKRLLPSIWSRVRAEFPEATLTLLGTGVSAEGVLNDFRPADRASITVIPRLDDEAEMMAQYFSHDLFLMPSLSEGSPLSLLEAMSAGIPAVAARVGGIPDIIAHEKDGLTFGPMDASEASAQLCRLLADAQMRSRMGRAAGARARSLSWAETAKAFEGALLAAVSPARAGDPQSLLRCPNS